MPQIGPRLTYWLPKTEFIVTAKRREVVTALSNGNFLRPVFDINVVHSVVADRKSQRRKLELEARFWETVATTITLDDRGFITAISSENTVEVAPYLELVGKLLPLVLPFIGILPPKEISLEEKWAADEDYATLSDHLSKLIDQVHKLLNELGRADADAATIELTGRALEVIQAQVASIVETRRLWMAAQETSVELTARLDTADLVRVTALDDSVKIDDANIPPAQAALLKDIGCVIAIADPERPSGRWELDRERQREIISIRRTRPVSVGVYVRDLIASELGEPAWSLEPTSVMSLDVLDDRCAEDDLLLNGKGTVELAFHPDMSIKTFGVKKAAAGTTIVNSLGGIVSSIVESQKKGDKPAAPEKDDFGIHLARTGGPYEALSAIHRRTSVLT